MEAVEFEVNELLQKQDANAKIVESMIERHENYKKKGLRIGELDMFDRIALGEDMECKAIELNSLYEEEKSENDTKKGIRLIELKSMLDEKGKKVHTDSTADAIIKQEFKDIEQAIQIHKLQAKLLYAKSSRVESYINIVKIYIKKDFTM